MKTFRQGLASFYPICYRKATTILEQREIGPMRCSVRPFSVLSCVELLLRGSFSFIFLVSNYAPPKDTTGGLSGSLFEHSWEAPSPYLGCVVWIFCTATWCHPVRLRAWWLDVMSDVIWACCLHIKLIYRNMCKVLTAATVITTKLFDFL